jgi:hypothetical protein
MKQWDSRFKRLSGAPGIVLINNYKCGFSSSNLLAHTTLTHIDDEEVVILFYRNIFLRAISVFINWCITDERYRTEKGWLFENFKRRLDHDQYTRFLGWMRMGWMTKAFWFYVESLDLVIEMNNHTLPQVSIFEYYGNIRIDHFVELENCHDFERLTGLAFPYQRDNKSEAGLKQSLIACLNNSERLQGRLRKLYRKDIDFFGRQGIDVASTHVLR